MPDIQHVQFREDVLHFQRQFVPLAAPAAARLHPHTACRFQSVDKLARVAANLPCGRAALKAARGVRGVDGGRFLGLGAWGGNGFEDEGCRRWLGGCSVRPTGAESALIKAVFIGRHCPNEFEPVPLKEVIEGDTILVLNHVFACAIGFANALHSTQNALCRSQKPV